MTNLKGPTFYRKLKAGLLIKDEFQKLHFLSEELKNGNASNADKEYWDEALSNVEDYLEYAPKYLATYNKYKERRFIVDHQARTREIRNYNGSLLVAGSLRGLFETLIVQREKHEKPNDVIIVLGDWMGFEGDIKSIHKAMELTEEGVIFLKGRNEEDFLMNAKEETPETFFVSSLPMDVQTPELIITTGNSLDEIHPIRKYLYDESPNMTEKKIVAVHPELGEDTIHYSAKDILLIAPGDAVRLDYKDYK